MIRDIQNTWIWRERNREQYWFWWTDLCLFARNKPSEYSADITLNRGEFVMSEGFFQKRWNTTRMKLRTFFAKLLREQWISSRYVGNFKVIKIVDYGEFLQPNNNLETTENYTENNRKITDISDSKSAFYTSQQPNGNQTATKIEANNNPNAALTNIRDIGIRDKGNNEMSNDIFVIGDADDAAPSAKDPTNPDKTIDLKKFMAYWNKTMQGKGLGRIIGIKNNRLLAIKARLREYGKQAIFEVVKKAAASTFLNNGHFNIDWIFCPNNFPKVLEGKYDNDRQQQKNAPNLPQNPKGGTKYKPSIFDARNEVLNELYAEINGDTDNSNTEETIHDADFAVVNG